MLHLIALAVALLVAGCGAAAEVALISTTSTTVAPVAEAETTAVSETGSLPTLPDGGGATTGPTPTTLPASPTSANEVEQPTTTTASSPVSSGSPRPEWLGSRVLPTDSNGVVVPQTTPAELVNRQLATLDTLPPPSAAGFEASIEPLTGDPLARSTWNEGCPVGVDELRYLRLGFWGFDGLPHQGEMIVNRTVAEDIVELFRSLWDQRFPLEEMRIVTQADLEAEPTGDGNNTTAFVCRAVVGGSRFSEHAYGLAIDINPFQNPYRKGDLVLPELAASYLDRSVTRPGMVAEGGPVVSAFDALGWGWGGRWSSLDDYHHFALNNR